jgi:hypothetical protein
VASYRTNRFSKCPECGFDLYNRGNKMGKEMSEMLRSKGFPYLKKILQTLGQDNEAIKELERRRIGGVPPIIKVEEK